MIKYVCFILLLILLFLLTLLPHKKNIYIQGGEKNKKYTFIGNSKKITNDCDVDINGYILYNTKNYIPTPKLTAIILLGNPGAGKTTIIKNVLKLLNLKMENFLRVDEDELRLYCNTFINDINGTQAVLDGHKGTKKKWISPNGDSKLDTWGYVNSDGKYMAVNNAVARNFKEVRNAMETILFKRTLNRYNLLYDSLCNNAFLCKNVFPNKFSSYDIIYIGVFTNPRTSKNRLMEKSFETGRYFPPDAIDKYTKKKTEWMNIFPPDVMMKIPNVTNYFIYFNDKDGSKPILESRYNKK